jgi:hypothetical protein
VLTCVRVVLLRILVTAALAALFGAAPASAGPFGPPLPNSLPPYVGKAPLAAASVHARPASDAAAIARGLRRAVAAGTLSRAEAHRYRAVVARTRGVMSAARGTRGAVLARVLGLVRARAGGYNRARALALFSMLDENARFLARRGLPPNETDVVGRGGIVYRVGWGYGLQFHPLANVAALNQHLYAGRLRKAADLASALAARGVRTRNGGIVWEYYFPYGGGSAPWSSGMAQAIGAQALARTGRRLTAPDFLAVARRAYRAIPGRLVRNVSTGPWVQLYSFSAMVVLNAQLQAYLSIADYARIVGDAGAAGLATRLEASARGLLPRFDTGAWSNYAPGQEAVLKYHLYHVDLAGWMARRTGHETWAEARARFARYTREAPVFKGGDPHATLYPWPRDGFRDRARISFWLSKISTVSVAVGGRLHPLGVERRGWHSIVWDPGRTQVRIYRPVVRAVDLAGNRGQGQLGPLRVAVDREPPAVQASVARRRLTWRAVDPTSPWLRMWAVVRRADVTKRLLLGRRPHRGSLVLPIPRGTWEAVLWVSDTTGNRTRVRLGPVPPPPGAPPPVSPPPPPPPS